MSNRSEARKLRSRIEALIPRAETGEQWANICALEAAAIRFEEAAEDEPVNEYVRDDAQFGVGA